MNGPRGYFGRGLDALDDCLMGRWAPLSLVWHDSEAASRCLDVASQTLHRPPTFEERLAFLAEGDRVDIHLA